MFSIMEMFYTFATNEPEILLKSDFTSNTCLKFDKTFEHLMSYGGDEMDINDKLKTENIKYIWSEVLRLYINIQTLLLKKLKYNFINEAELFIGSYNEIMMQVCMKLRFLNLF